MNELKKALLSNKELNRRDTFAINVLNTLLSKPATDVLNPQFANRILGRGIDKPLEQNDGERALVRYAVLIADIMLEELE